MPSATAMADSNLATASSCMFGRTWDDGITEAELSEILQATQETSSEEKEPSSEEKEAERKAKCEAAKYLNQSSRRSDRAQAEIVSTLMENGCFSSP